MVRLVKKEEYAARRNEILDAAQRIVMETKGYAGMAIQDILDDLQISKGAFYHYFDSKQALLEALIGRMVEEAEPLLTAIVDDPNLPALEKLRRFFDQIVRWKTARRDYLMALLHVWYADENAIVRQKLRATMPTRFSPVLTQVIEQGIEEGVFATAYPGQAGEVVLSLLQDLGDSFAGQLLVYRPEQDELQHIAGMVAAYTDAVEHVLGTPRGSLTLVDPQTIHAWFDPVLEPAPPPPG